MHAHLIYTEVNYMLIVVINETYDAVSDEHTTSNVFYYTYLCDVPVQPIIPRTYNEAMWYLDGRRKFNAMFRNDDEKIENLQ